jgi:hypothetical protein
MLVRRSAARQSTIIYELVNREKQIDIIVTHWTCKIAPILQFHFTVSMYPDWTCERKGFVHLRFYIEYTTNPPHHRSTDKIHGAQVPVVRRPFLIEATRVQEHVLPACYADRKVTRRC